MLTPEQLYDLHCETVGGGKMGHVHWDDLPLETRIQWGRFAASAVVGAKVTEELLKWLEYRNDVLKSAWCIVAEGIKEANPDADPEYDTNNFYGYIRAGVEAQRKVADGEKAIAAFLAEQVESASQQLDEAVHIQVAVAAGGRAGTAAASELRMDEGARSQVR